MFMGLPELVAASPITAPSLAAQALTALAVTAAIRVAEQRPRGWLHPDLLRIAPSRVPNGGRGVFAAKDLAEGTVLGAYPGRLCSPGAYYRKIKEFPRTANYCWKLGGDRGSLDPTDVTGVLCEPLPFLERLPISLMAVDTTLALINEPCPGFDVNVCTEETQSDVLFVTERAVLEGEELYLDYGQDYDRSDYRR